MHWADDMPPIRNDKGHVDLLAHRVLGHLARRANNETLQAWPTVQQMAIRTGFERREIRRALMTLEKLGIIVDYGEADSGATIWFLALSEPGPVEHLQMLEAQRTAILTKSNAERQSRHRARRNSTGGVTAHPEPATSESNSGGPVTVPKAPAPSNSEEPVMSQRGARYVTAETPLRNAASAPLTTKAQLPMVELPTVELPTPADRSAHPTEEAPRMLRNFNGYRPPEEPAKPTKSRTSPPTDDPDFDRAWELYGYKTGRVAAIKKWAQAMKIVDAETIIAAIPAYVAISRLPKEPERKGVTIRAHFATWLHGQRWEDEIEPPRKGYQGQAGSDARPRQEYEDDTKHLPVPALMRKSPFILNRQGCYAWYWYWNRDQADWDLDQLIAFGNTPDDARVLHEVFRTGPREGWADLLATVNIEMERP
jgi:hypothetical protein